jgi:hypothetical protein
LKSPLQMPKLTILLNLINWLINCF